MALDPLATTADLENRGVDTNGDAVSAALDAASSAVREAAGVAISEVTSTVVLSVQDAVDGCWLTLPGVSVSAVSSVLIGVTAVTDYTRRGNRLHLACGWRRGCYPYDEVTIAYTHGLATVPADIVELVCALAATMLASTTADYGSTAAIASRTEAIDDWRETVTYSTSESSASAVEIPERTRLALAARFGGGTYVTGSRR